MWYFCKYTWTLTRDHRHQYVGEFSLLAGLLFNMQYKTTVKEEFDINWWFLILRQNQACIIYLYKNSGRYILYMCMYLGSVTALIWEAMCQRDNIKKLTFAFLANMKYYFCSAHMYHTVLLLFWLLPSVSTKQIWAADEWHYVQIVFSVDSAPWCVLLESAGTRLSLLQNYVNYEISLWPGEMIFLVTCLDFHLF